MLERKLTRAELERMGVVPTRSLAMLKDGSRALCLAVVFCPEMRHNPELLNAVAIGIARRLRKRYGRNHRVECMLGKLVLKLTPQQVLPPAAQ